MNGTALDRTNMPAGDRYDLWICDLDGDGNSDLQMSFDQDGEYVTYVWYWNTVRGEFMDTLAD